MSGDQSILKAHGACARVINPTCRMSTPIECIQSGIAIVTRPSGRPEEKDSSATAAVRHDVIAVARLANVPGRRAGGDVIVVRGSGFRPAACAPIPAPYDAYQAAARGASRGPFRSGPVVC